MRLPVLPRILFALLALALAGAMLGGVRGASAAERDRDGEEEREREAASAPRLVLPGSHAVHAGQWIDLRWTDADSIAEMEVLLSEDGGRHYEECVTPQLDPHSHHFLWRVPEREGGELRLRIRFNRGGREIEAAPEAPLQVVAGGASQPEPLALPPLAAGGAAPVKPSNDREAGSSARLANAAEADAESVSPRRPVCTPGAALLQPPARRLAGRSAARFRTAGIGLPRTTPLRP
jgi:hypothetical protein